MEVKKRVYAYFAIIVPLIMQNYYTKQTNKYTQKQQTHTHKKEQTKTNKTKQNVASLLRRKKGTTPCGLNTVDHYATIVSLNYTQLLYKQTQQQTKHQTNKNKNNKKETKTTKKKQKTQKQKQQKMKQKTEPHPNEGGREPPRMVSHAALPPEIVRHVQYLDDVAHSEAQFIAL